MDHLTGPARLHLRCTPELKQRIVDAAARTCCPSAAHYIRRELWRDMSLMPSCSKFDPRVPTPTGAAQLLIPCHPDLPGAVVRRGRGYGRTGAEYLRGLLAETVSAWSPP